MSVSRYQNTSARRGISRRNILKGIGIGVGIASVPPVLLYALRTVGSNPAEQELTTAQQILVPQQPTYETAQLYESKRQEYINRLFQRISIPELGNVVYDPEKKLWLSEYGSLYSPYYKNRPQEMETLLDQLKQDVYGRNGYMTTPHIADLVGTGYKSNVYVFPESFFYTDNEDEFLSALKDHEIDAHVKDFYHGIVIGDRIIDSKCSDNACINNRDGGSISNATFIALIELRAYHNQFKEIEEGARRVRPTFRRGVAENAVFFYSTLEGSLLEIRRNPKTGTELEGEVLDIFLSEYNKSLDMYKKVLRVSR